jgi:hypothetical protein
MAGTTKRPLAILGLVIATAGSLDQCAKDLGREMVPDRSFEAYLQQGFGPVQQKTVGTNDEGGAIIEISVTSTQSKSWGDAQSLMSRKAGCGDGRAFTPEWVSPALRMEAPDAVGAAMAQPHAPRTTFTMRHSCEGPLPGEIAIAPAIKAPQAMALIEERIGGIDAYDPDGVTNIAVQITLTKERPKYTAFNEQLGYSTKFAYRACRGPATLEQVVAGELPLPPGEESEWATGYLLVGLDFACTPRTDTDPSTPATPSPT